MNNVAYLPKTTRPAIVQPQRQASGVKTIPFDYIFKLDLTGKRGNQIQSVLEISREGVFVALSIGYSLAPLTTEEKIRKGIVPQEMPTQKVSIQNPTIIPSFSFQEDDGVATIGLEGMLVSGIPGAVINLIATDPEGYPIVVPTYPERPKISRDGTIEIKFKTVYSDVRPWDYIWWSTNLLVLDRTNNLASNLLYIKDKSDTWITPFVGPNRDSKKLPNVGDTKLYVYGLPERSINVFLAKSSTGYFQQINEEPMSLIKKTIFNQSTGVAEVTLNEGLALSQGDILFVKDSQRDVLSSILTIPSEASVFSFLESLGIDLSLLGCSGISSLIAATASSSTTETTVTPLIGTEELSFLYSLDVVGTGRELQNEPIHNLAGLGNATGERPFRPFAKPMFFEPKSFLRIQVTELVCPQGTLYMVLHGYKILGSGRIPG